MRPHAKHSLLEWTFLVLLFVLSGILTALQYHWTGAISRAESERLRNALTEQAQALANGFDKELEEACRQLMPSDAELDELGRDAAHLRRYRQWQAGRPRPLFTRLAVVTPMRDGLDLQLLDPAQGAFGSAPWPESWSALQEYVDRRQWGIPASSGPFRDPSGALLQIAAYGGPRGVREWLLLELDLDYTRRAWLPELVQAHFTFGDRMLCGVEVRTATTPPSLVFTSEPSASQPPAPNPAAITVRFHPQYRSTEPGRGRPPDAPPPPEGRTAQERGLWILEIRPRPGALEAVVAKSRRRNLAVAVALNGLILAAGVALVLQTRRSRQLSEAQIRFVASVSHELRTPLTVIRGAAHNIQRGVVQERGRLEQYSQLILRHTEHLTEMIEQLLELAGAQRREASYAMQPVELPALLAEALTACRREIELAGCKVEVSIAQDLPGIRGDPSALRRVFQNLLVNAARHGNAGGWIGLAASRIPRHGKSGIEVRVSDRGPGIPEAEQAEIFKPFVRGRAAQDRQVRGSGLGLSLVQEIVEAHSGTVHLQSRPGEGATITLHLPLDPNTGS